MVGLLNLHCKALQMNIFTPVFFNTKTGRDQRGPDIYADSDMTQEEVVRRYCEHAGCQIGETNVFGGKLLRVELVEEGVRFKVTHS